jgi:hypothetical protein
MALKFGRIVKSTKNAKEITGFDEFELIDKQISELMPESISV